MSDTTRSLIQSASKFLSGTMLSRLTGVLRDILMASYFGTHSSIAAFFVAYRFAHLLRRVFGEGAMQTAFIPTFEGLRSENPENGGRFFCSLYSFLSLFLASLILFAMTAIYWTQGVFTLSADNQEIFSLLFLMMPSLLFICLYGLNSSLLYCEKKYFISGVAPAAFNCVWILGVILIGMYASSTPLFWLSLTIVAASLFQWLLTVPATIKSLRLTGVRPLTALFSFRFHDLKVLIRPFFLGVIGVAATQINSAVDAIFARIADSEGPAYLWYAIRIQQLPLSLFAVAFSGALLPPLSRAYKQQDFDRFKTLLSFAYKKCLMVMIPMTFMLIFFGEWGIRLVYGRGQFTESSILQTAFCLYAYTVGLIPMALVLVIAPAFYSKKEFGVTSAGAILSMGLNILLNSCFVLVMGWGSFSIALATSLSAWANLAFLMFFNLRSRRYSNLN